MLTYTGLRNLYGDLSNDASTANLTLGDTLINQAQRKILGMYNWPFTYGAATATTVAATQTYQLPNDAQRVVAVTVTVGSTIYPVDKISSMAVWNALNSTSETADVPECFYVIGNTINFYPSTTVGNTITYYYKKKVKDLSTADYTTGTLTLANASAAVVGSGTTFTALMVGRYLKATNDGFWYEITSYTSATAITLKKVFQGASAASLAYTIGEVPIIPEEYQYLLAYDAAATYYQLKDEAARADRFKADFNAGLAAMRKEYGSTTTNGVISDDIGMTNPNLFISL